MQKSALKRWRKNKLAELEYIKDTVVILLEDIPSHSDWKNKRQLLEYLMPYICNNDKRSIQING